MKEESVEQQVLRAQRASKTLRNELTETIIAKLTPLINKNINKYSYLQIPTSDVKQLCCLSIIKSIDKFKESKQSTFIPFVAMYTKKTILDYYKQKQRIIRLPDHVYSKVKAIKAAGLFVNQKATKPSQLKLTDKQIDFYINIYKDNNTRDLSELEEILPGNANQEKSLLQKEKQEVIGVAINKLTARQKKIILLSFGAGLSNVKIAKRVNCSATLVAKELKASFSKLRIILQGWESEK